jgi:hypothetical protein
MTRILRESIKKAKTFAAGPLVKMAEKFLDLVLDQNSTKKREDSRLKRQFSHGCWKIKKLNKLFVL